MKKNNNTTLGIEQLSGLAERKSLGQHVFENLKQAIINGKIPAGQRLVENRLAETLGISRTPVREAIHKLEREGFLGKRPRGGFVVLGLDSVDIEETFGIRSVLEGYAARLAAIRHAENDLEPLEAHIQTFQQHLDNDELEILPDLNTEFHDMLYAISKSPRLIKMINDLKDQIFRFRQMVNLLKVGLSLLDRQVREGQNPTHISLLFTNCENFKKLISLNYPWILILTVILNIMISGQNF